MQIHFHCFFLLFYKSKQQQQQQQQSSCNQVSGLETINISVFLFIASRALLEILNSIDFYKGISLHVIPVYFVVPWYDHRTNFWYKKCFTSNNISLDSFMWKYVEVFQPIFGTLLIVCTIYFTIRGRKLKL